MALDTVLTNKSNWMSYPGVPVQQLVHAEVLVVVSERIVEGLRHPQPAEEEEKLEAEKNGDPDVDGLLAGVVGEEGLVPHQGHREVGVHRQGHHLHEKKIFMPRKIGNA